MATSPNQALIEVEMRVSGQEWVKGGATGAGKAAGSPQPTPRVTL